MPRYAPRSPRHQLNYEIATMLEPERRRIVENAITVFGEAAARRLAKRLRIDIDECLTRVKPPGPIIVPKGEPRVRVRV